MWFPSPVGGLDCHRAGSGQAALLVDAFPTLRRASMRIASPLGPGRQAPGVRLLGHIPVVSTALTGGKAARRREPDGDWGAVWVEVRGRRGRSEEILVYGAVDRMAFAVRGRTGCGGAVADRARGRLRSPIPAPTGWRRLSIRCRSSVSWPGEG